MCSQREIEFPLCSEMEEQRAQGDGEENLMPPPTAPPTPIIASLQFNPINDDQRMAALMIRLRENQTSTSNLSVEELMFLMNRILPKLSLEHINLLCRLLSQIYVL